MATIIRGRESPEDREYILELLYFPHHQFQALRHSIRFSECGRKDPPIGHVPGIIHKVIETSKPPFSHISNTKIIFQARIITEKDSWPSIFEEAIAARWNAPITETLRPIVFQPPSHQGVPQQVAASVVQNLGNLKKAFQSKHMGNIINNIELAASYLSIMTLVCQLLLTPRILEISI